MCDLSTFMPARPVLLNPTCSRNSRSIASCSGARPAVFSYLAYLFHWSLSIKLARYSPNYADGPPWAALRQLSFQLMLSTATSI